MTLYLKYRPQKIADLDLVEVKEVLGKILAGKNLPHAWLFSGPRGTGKTSSARIVAKAVNCTKKKGFEPCNECEMCLAITNGSAYDIVEIDAASNRGIDEIRELRDKVRLAPMQATTKVYIIDEVHMLTTEAANALLKTLEEPPEHTMFILCTTEPEKLPDTVVSRCTRIAYKKPSVKEAVTALKTVAEGEKLGKIEEHALEQIAKAAKGSFRDGTKLLEQVIMLNEGITEAAVLKILGMVDTGEPEQFIKLIKDNQGKAAMELINELVKKGVNLRSWVERVVDCLREEMLQVFATKDKQGLNEIMELIERVEKAYEGMKTTAVPQLPLEMVVVERCGQERQEKEIEIEKVTIPHKTIEKIEIKPEVRESVKHSGPSGKGKFGLEDVIGKWAEILKAVRPMNHSVEALLRSTKPVDFDGEKLTLEVFYKFHKDKLETEKIRSMVEEAVGGVFGVGKIKLYLKLGEKQTKKQEVTGENVGEDILKAAEAIFKAEVV